MRQEGCVKVEQDKVVRRTLETSTKKLFVATFLPLLIQLRSSDTTNSTQTAIGQGFVLFLFLLQSQKK